MKWTIAILVFIFAGWKITVFLMNKNNGVEKSSVSNSLQANKLFRDSTKTDSTKITDSVKIGLNKTVTITKNNLTLPKGSIDTKNVQPQQIIDFAKTLIGVPYLYGSTDPKNGFDCSGFITYIFNHFSIIIPRSSIDFTNVGREVSAVQAKSGDLILFTGTDSTEKFVGHMGIVISNTDSLRFIHSSSGKNYGVTITPLNAYYKSRYVKTIRLFSQNN